MTAMETPRTKSPPIPHQRVVIKLFHGIIIVSLLIMMASGLQIYNANPVFGGREGWNFPSAITLGGWLSGGRNWHFAMMWVFSFNLLIYGIYIGLTKRWQRRFVSGNDLQALKTGQNSKRKAYAWHRLLYTGIIPILLLAIASGLAMYKPVQLAWLANLFGSWQTLRTIHFLTVPLASLFIIAHVLMGIKVGGMRILRSMFI
jgi:thiosulfate reductase cytochrome b subunit